MMKEPTKTTTAAPIESGKAKLEMPFTIEVKKPVSGVPVASAVVLAAMAKFEKDLVLKVMV